MKIIKYWGIIIDDKLPFKDHCKYQLKKIDESTKINKVGHLFIQDMSYIYIKQL